MRFGNGARCGQPVQGGPEHQVQKNGHEICCLLHWHIQLEFDFIAQQKTRLTHFVIQAVNAETARKQAGSAGLGKQNRDSARGAFKRQVKNARIAVTVFLFDAYRSQRDARVRNHIKIINFAKVTVLRTVSRVDARRFDGGREFAFFRNRRVKEQHTGKATKRAIDVKTGVPDRERNGSFC